MGFAFILPTYSFAEYEFSVDWFSPSRPLFEKHLLSLAEKGQPVRYLEIGILEGRSFLWVIDNIMTNPKSKAVGIDLFDSAKIEARFNKNLASSKYPDRAEIHKGDSQDVMRKLDIEQFDYIYVDGGHTAFEAINDLVQAFRLAKPNGLIVVDDYSLFEKELPVFLRPQIAVDSFLKSYRTKVEVVDIQRHKVETSKNEKPVPWGVVIKKLENPCDRVKVNFRAEGMVYNQCTRLSDSSYYLWTEQKVYAESKSIELSKNEIKRIEKYLKSLAQLDPLDAPVTPNFLKNIMARGLNLSDVQKQ
jgi:predicted O-methyltransferase YrrM